MNSFAARWNDLQSRVSGVNDKSTALDLIRVLASWFRANPRAGNEGQILIKPKTFAKKAYVLFIRFFLASPMAGKLQPATGRRSLSNPTFRFGKPSREDEIQEDT